MKKFFLALTLVISALGVHAQHSNHSNKYLAGTSAGKDYIFALVPMGGGSIQEKIYFGSAEIPAAERVYSPVVRLEDQNRSSTGVTWVYNLANGQEVRVQLDADRNIISATCGEVTLRKSW